MTGFAAAIDALTEDDLRAAGSLKWTAFPDCLGAFVAEMDFGLAPAIRRELDRMHGQGLTGYTPYQWRADLKVATTEYLASRHNWAVAPDQVVLVPDVLAALTDTLVHFCEPHAPVIVPTPCYMPFSFLPAHYGHEIIQVPMRDADGWRLDLGDLDAAFARGGRLLVLCNPHNPIGKVYTRAEMDGICEVVERHHGQVFADEIHAPLVYDGVHVPYAATSERATAHTITAFSASKSFNTAGLKCAQYVLTNPEQAAWARGKDLEHEPAALGVAANIAAYREGWDWLAEVLEYLDGTRRELAAMVAELLPKSRMRLPEATFLAWLDVREYSLGDHPARFFREHARVALTDGRECGAAGVGHVRLNFAAPRPLVREMVERMASALAGK